MFKNVRDKFEIVLFTILFLSISLYLAKPLFGTNDDMYMIRILSGQYGTELSGNPIFMSPILGRLLASLYRFQPAFPWYTALLYFVLLLGLIIGLEIIISQINKKAFRWAAVFGFTGLYMYIWVRLNFASCSLALWFMTFLLAFTLTLKNKSINYLDYLLALLPLFSYLIRPDIITKTGLIFILPLAVFFLFFKDGRKRLALFILPIIIVATISMIDPDYKTIQPESYRSLQFSRSNILDTNLGNMNENSKIALKKAGWSMADYFLLKHWWTYDESIYNQTIMKEFIKNNNPTILNLVSLIQGFQDLFSTFMFFSIIIILSMILIKFDDKLTVNNKLNKISWILIITTATLIFGLACIRFPYHVAVPLYLYLLMLLIILRPTIPVKRPRSNRFIIEVALVILLINCFNIRSLIKQADWINSLTTQNKIAIQSVMQHNGQDTIFFNLTPNLVNIEGNPITEVKQGFSYNDTTNQWLIGSDQYYSYLAKYGFASGRELIQSSIDNPQAVFYLYQPPFRNYGKFTEYVIEHFNAHYGKTGKHYKLDILLDTRSADETGIESGWVYFRIQSINI